MVKSAMLKIATGRRVGEQEDGLQSLLHLNSAELFLVVRIQVQRRPLTLFRSIFLPFSVQSF
jgi:hypothetical protein